jgi:hypothetical protein
MAEEITVIGVEQARADLQRWMKNLPGDIAREMATFASQLRTTLADRVPYVTGTLSGSAEIVPGEVDTIFGLMLGREVAYAGWIEFGGSRGRDLVPQGRYVYPVAHEGEPEFDRLVEGATQVSIDHYPWSTPPGT